MKLSIVIIARNAEEKIGDCLKSLLWADEILVVDNASTDKTSEIAKKYGVKVIRAPEKLVFNYAELRNLGLKEAKGEWILYVDADERVSSGLKKEITSLVTSHQSPATSFAIPRRNFIFGKEFRHGGQWPDYQKRLFRKSNLGGWKGELHEEPVLVESASWRIGHLKNPFVHIKENDLSQMVEKTNNWSEIEAREMYKAGHPQMNIPRFFSAGFREFWLRFVRQLAFLDGTEGVIYGMYQVYSRLISYAKLWEIQMKHDTNMRIRANDANGY